MAGKVKLALLAAAVSLFVLLAGRAPCGAGVVAPELEYALESLDPNEELPVIVHLSRKADLRPFRHQRRPHRRAAILRALRGQAESAQRPLRALLKARRARRVRALWAINGLAVTAPAGVVRELARQPGVDLVRYDTKLSAPEVAPAAVGAAEWNLSAVRAPELWALGYTGQGVVVASLDTGVDADHPDLAERWRGGANSWYDPNGEHAIPYDADGHGTQAMGLMVGGSAGGTAIGVAPGAEWIAVKIYNDRGETTLSAIHLGFQWLLDPDGDPDTDDAPDVVNNSWGLRANPGECVGEFQEDVRTLKASGMAVVFPAGNEGPSPETSLSPANYPESLAVGAVDEGLVVAAFSSRGPSACDGALYPHLVAPGVAVRTADLTFGGLIPDSYAYVSGASFAAPQAAGALALLAGAFPEAQVSGLEQALKDSAADLGPSGPENDYGFGLVDVAAAYELLAQPNDACHDADADGFFAEEGCGTPPDCDDTDAAVYPGAAEVKHDGLDQDCNGYDLTLDVRRALYRARKQTLIVVATSALGEQAALEVAGFGPMSWDARRQHWTLSASNVAADPGTVTVSGVEGSQRSGTTLWKMTRYQRLLREVRRLRRLLREHLEAPEPGPSDGAPVSGASP
jgi:bacillopeptidase F